MSAASSWLALLIVGAIASLISALLLAASRHAPGGRLRRVALQVGLPSAALLLAALAASDGDATFLLWAALAAAAGSALLMAVRLRSGSERLEVPARFLAHGATFALAAALLHLTLAFLLKDLRIAYVWEHTRVTYPFWYRFSGVWASQEGTIVLWGALLAAFLSVLLARRTSSAGEARVRGWMHLFLAGLVAAFTWLMIHEETFRATTPAQLTSIPFGRGMQEVLLTPFMVIHPPMQFVAYALAAMPACAALAYLATGERAWSTLALRWARPAWLFSTVGLGLGGLWAYYVLSFGGYWAWDPVETANLLPWLALTALLHALKNHEKFGDLRLATPVLAVLGLFLTVFATFATRSGLWVSVHAFTDPTNKFNPDPAERFMSILEVHWPTGFFIGVLGVLAFGTAALALLASARDGIPATRPLARRAAEGFAAGLLALAALSAFAPGTVAGLTLESGSRLLAASPGLGMGAILAALVGGGPLLIYLLQSEESEGRKLQVDLRTLMAAAVLLFAIALAVTTLLDFQVINGLDRTPFDVRAPYVTIPILLVMGVAFTFQETGRGRALLAAGVALALGVAAALLYPKQWALAAAMPPLVFALAASVAKLIRVNLRRDAAREERWGAGLLLLSSLLGLVMWSNPPSSIPFPGGAVPVSAWVGVTLFFAALLGFLASLAAFHGHAPALQRAGGAAAALAAGYGVGAPLAVAALVLLARAPRRAARACQPRLFPTLAPHLRQSGIYLIHVAVVVGLIGIAASTYAAEEGAYEVTPGGDPVALGSATFHIGGVQEGPEKKLFTIPLELRPASGSPERTELVFFWNADSLRGPHYDSHLNVQRGFTRDVYLVPTGIRIGEGENARWIQGPHDVDFSGQLAQGEVTKVRFTATFLPFMTFVWAGLWLMGAGMLMVLAGALAPKAARATAAAQTAEIRMNAEKESAPVAEIRPKG